MLRKEGYKVKTASTRSNKGLRLIEMLGLIVRYHKTTDVVLIDTYGAMNFYYAYLVAKTCQAYHVDYIPILHGGNLPDRLHASKKFSQSLFGRAKVNIAPSNFLYDIFKEEGFNNTQIIPNAIQMENYPFKKREEFTPKLLWVRRFQKRYNPIMALEVLLLLKKDYPKATLCMVGPDKDGTMKACRKFAEKHQLNVQFTGKLKKKDWARLSKNYDFFINTTNIDNTPISVIEAMSLGLAVVSTNIGGMPMLIDHNKNGILVPVNDAKTMASEISKLVEDSEKAQLLSKNARDKVEAFAWKKVKTDWNEILNS